MLEVAHERASVIVCEKDRLNMVMTLQRKLTETNMACVPDGVHHIDEIYSIVEESHADLVDDTICTTGWAAALEWKHKVRNALQTLKGKGRVHKTGLNKGYWRIQVKLNGKVMADICCGSRAMWWDKEHPNCIYMDIREEVPGTIELQPNWSVKPDVIGDYREMFFVDGTFHLIMWDPPHIMEAKGGLMLKKYGKLGMNWQRDMSVGFKEVWRVLKPYGVLLFKYNDLSISVGEMLNCFFEMPLVGTRTKKSVGSNGTGTYWFAFMKLPEESDGATDENFDTNQKMQEVVRNITERYELEIKVMKHNHEVEIQELKRQLN